MKAERTIRRKRKKRILIVDDEKMICESLDFLLSGNSFEISSVHTGEDALALTDSKLPNLIILDYSLPGIDGLQVLAAIREKSQKIPVIFMTGYGSESVSIKAFKLGITDYFIKPFHPSSMKARVIEVLGSRRKTALNKNQAMLSDFDAESEKSSGIRKVVHHVKNHYRSRITLEEASKIAGFSRYHFARSFKREVGTPFSDYLSRLRVKKAEEILLSQNINVTEVAYLVGFNNLRQFERNFKKVSGKSPNEFRRV